MSLPLFPHPSSLGARNKMTGPVPLRQAQGERALRRAQDWPFVVSVSNHELRAGVLHSVTGPWTCRAMNSSVTRAVVSGSVPAAW